MSSVHKFGKYHKREGYPFMSIADGCRTETVYGLGIPVVCHESDSPFRCLVVPTNWTILRQIQVGDSLLVVSDWVCKTGRCPIIVGTVQFNLHNGQSEQLRLC